MKKNFSQPFTKAEHIGYSVLSEDSKTGKFLLLHPLSDNDSDYDSGEFYATPRFDLNEGEDVAQQVARVLFEYGHTVNRLRELIRQTELSYSFVDDTPGETKQEVCMHVVGDSSDIAQKDRHQEVLYVTLPELMNRLEESASLSSTIELGIVKLSLEREVRRP